MGGGDKFPISAVERLRRFVDDPAYDFGQGVEYKDSVSRVLSSESLSLS